MLQASLARIELVRDDLAGMVDDPEPHASVVELVMQAATSTVVTHVVHE
jgi:hypothetical protein